MAGVNKAIIVGRLGSDPETKTPQSGPITRLSVATSESWKDKSGNNQERVEWHKVVCFGNLANNCAKFLSKGSQVYIEGKIQTRSWENNEGQKQYTTEIVAKTVQFIDTKKNDGDSHGSWE